MNNYVTHQGMLAVVVGEDPDDPDRTIIGIDGIYESVLTDELESRHTKTLWINSSQINAIEKQDDHFGPRTRITMAGWTFDTTDDSERVLANVRNHAWFACHRIT